jgi:hypothetical protein
VVPVSTVRHRLVPAPESYLREWVHWVRVGRIRVKSSRGDSDCGTGFRSKWVHWVRAGRIRVKSSRGDSDCL